MFNKKNLTLIAAALILKRRTTISRVVKDDIDALLQDVASLQQSDEYVSVDAAYVAEATVDIAQYKEDLQKTAKLVMCSSLKQVRANIDETMKELIIVGYLTKCLEMSSLTQRDCAEIQRIREDMERFELNSLPNR